MAHGILSQNQYEFGFVPNRVMKNVYLASAVDLVDNYWDPLHPRYKEDVGVRLSLGALNRGYNISIEYSAPKVATIRYDDSTINIFYASTDNNPLVFDVVK